MEKSILFNDFFTNIDCSMIIFFEDEFSLMSPSEIDKSKLLYGLSRIDLDSRERLFSEIDKGFSDLVKNLRAFFECFDSAFGLIDNWNEEVIRDDMLSCLECIEEKNQEVYKKILYCYNSFEVPDLSEVSTKLLKYGLCINISPLYQKIFDEYLFRENRWKPVRIFTNFEAENNKIFISELEMFFSKYETGLNCVCCIIDNDLAGEKRANDIISEISRFNSETRNNIIGAIATSYEETERIDESIFLEYVNKTNIETNLQTALLKSAYNYAISKLKSEMVNGLNSAFSKATTNRNIAFYLSQMAVSEGMANYQIIHTWINAMCDYELSNSKIIPSVIKITNLINQIDGERYEIDNELDLLNTFEAFDFNINKYNQPPAAGDVFIDTNNKVYILIGQDCDHMMSKSRKRRSALAELIPAQILPQTEMYKVKNNLNYVMLNNFRIGLEETPCCLKIDYTKREFLENEVLDLCTYDEKGNCQMDVAQELTGDIVKIIMPYLVDYYSQLQKYFSSIKRLKEIDSESLETLLDDERTPRLIPVHKGEICGTKFRYPLRRICRLTETYVLYLYKLYLEYRGRQPFNSINIARTQALDIPIVDSSISGEMCVQIVLSGDRNANSKLVNLPWEISKSEINRVLLKMEIDSGTKEQHDFIALEAKITNVPLKNGSILKITRFNKPTIKLELV